MSCFLFYLNSVVFQIYFHNKSNIAHLFEFISINIIKNKQEINLAACITSRNLYLPYSNSDDKSQPISEWWIKDDDYL